MTTQTATYQPRIGDKVIANPGAVEALCWATRTNRCLRGGW